MKFNIFNTIYTIDISIKITKRVPKFATVKLDTNWIYKGMKLKVDSVYMEEGKYDEPGSGRHLRLSLEGTEFGPGTKHNSKSTVIREKDLILHY